MSEARLRHDPRICDYKKPGGAERAVQADEEEFVPTAANRRNSARRRVIRNRLRLDVPNATRRDHLDIPSLCTVAGEAQGRVRVLALKVEANIELPY